MNPQRLRASKLQTAKAFRFTIILSSPGRRLSILSPMLTRDTHSRVVETPSGSHSIGFSPYYVCRVSSLRYSISNRLVTRIAGVSVCERL
jgi:hypothetical protein